MHVRPKPLQSALISYLNRHNRVSDQQVQVSWCDICLMTFIVSPDIQKDSFNPCMHMVNNRTFIKLCT